MAQVIDTLWLKEGLGGNLDSSSVITQTESAIIVFSDIIPTFKEAVATSGFYVGQVHRNDNTMILQPDFEANVIDEDNAKVWRFDLTYSTAGFNPQSGNEDTQTDRVSISKWTYNRTVTADLGTRAPILLPTGEPYDAAFIEQVSAPIISITVKEYSANIGRIEKIGSINDSSLNIAGISCPKYCAMLDDYNPQPHRDEQGYLTFRNTFKIKLKFANNAAGNEIGFKIETLAASFNQLVDGKLEAIRVADPEFPDNRKKDILAATPQMVDEDGKLTTEPFYQEWLVNNAIPFGNFGLPSSYPVS